MELVESTQDDGASIRRGSGEEAISSYVRREDLHPDDDERVNISTDHRRFLEEFREYWKREGSNGDISAFASSLGNLNQSLNKSGKMQRTLLHMIANRGFEHLDGGKYLVQWLMDKYPDLYRTVDDLGRSILDTVIRSGMNTERDRDSIIKLFVQEFPTQTADLLKLVDAGILHTLVAKLIRLDCPEIFFQQLDKRLILSPDIEKGNTLLHVAARCIKQKGLMEVAEHQLEVVTRIFEACPQALSVLNHDGQSAYKHRLHSCSSDLGAVPPISSDDPISSFLKTKIMNLMNRDEILRLLYGQSQGLEIELDLIDFPSIGTIDRGRLKNLLMGLEFESILKYVRLPVYTLRKDPSLDNRWESPTYTQLKEQYELIFDTLHLQKVRKIVRIIVQDDGIPYRDEDIERMLHPFDVKEWDWKKIDICSEVIFNTAPNARQVFLYSSGNNAILRSWSTEDGLGRLRNLKDVKVTVSEQLEGQERTRDYLESFMSRMKHCLPGTQVEVQMEGNDQQKLNINVSGRRVKHSWFHKMDAFAHFIQKTSKRRDSQRGVRVALIDDGVDLLQPALEKRVKAGISFTTYFSSDTLTKPYYLSSLGHGTLMAKLISRVCPMAELYVARIDDPLTGQLNIDSAAKALEWAVAKKVDIISMSWTFEGEHDRSGMTDLEVAIKRACEFGILLFASASHSDALTLPAGFREVFSIGAATAMGKSSSWIDGRRIDFILPGSEPGMKPHSTDAEDLDNGIVPGSSIATALAAGLAGMILYCVEICGLGEEWRGQLQSYDGMKRVLREMTQDSKFIGRIETFFNPEITELGGDEGLQALGQDIQKLFLKVLR